MTRAGKPVRTLNEAAALRWFLFVFRLCEPRVLADLAVEGAESFSRGRSAAFRTWYAEWVDRYRLPRTGQMRSETEDTLTYGYLDSPERRWHFELPPQPSEVEDKLNAYTRNLMGGRSAADRPFYLPVRVDFPPYPVDGTEADWSRYKRKFWEHARKVLDDLETTRAHLRESMSELAPPEVVWPLLPCSPESVNSKRPVRKVARDLVFLAMRQAEATYSEIPEKFAPALRNQVPGEFLDPLMAPERHSGLPKAVRSAARRIGLDEGQLFQAKRGPRHAS